MANKIVRRGDIWGTDLKESHQFMLKSLHPVIIISNYKAIENSEIIQIVPITSKQKSQPTHVELDESCGLKHQSIALAEQLTTILKSDLKFFIGKVNYRQMLDLEEALKLQLGLSENITNLKDLQDTKRMISNIEELDRYIQKTHNINAIRERKIALKCLENFLINHSINIDISRLYLKEYEGKEEKCYNNSMKG